MFITHEDCKIIKYCSHANSRFLFKPLWITASQLLALFATLRSLAGCFCLLHVQASVCTILNLFMSSNGFESCWLHFGLNFHAPSFTHDPVGYAQIQAVLILHVKNIFYYHFFGFLSQIKLIACVFKSLTLDWRLTGVLVCTVIILSCN